MILENGENSNSNVCHIDKSKSNTFGRGCSATKLGFSLPYFIRDEG